ncbi:hypothetical protein DM860_017722 [Cuscuta australis]|uniref:SHSP domain-containing protein n=1 Tax=Cuscuta australis TaxID=267555 RepID=A0A328DBA2_9ASTE|nr:hypothetical protein DM860_017722 [Cuscuta australis]
MTRTTLSGHNNKNVEYEQVDVHHLSCIVNPNNILLISVSLPHEFMGEHIKVTIRVSNGHLIIKGVDEASHKYFETSIQASTNFNIGKTKASFLLGLLSVVIQKLPPTSTTQVEKTDPTNETRPSPSSTRGDCEKNNNPIEAGGSIIDGKNEGATLLRMMEDNKARTCNGSDTETEKQIKTRRETTTGITIIIVAAIVALSSLFFSHLYSQVEM